MVDVERTNEQMIKKEVVEGKREMEGEPQEEGLKVMSEVACLFKGDIEKTPSLGEKGRRSLPTPLKATQAGTVGEGGGWASLGQSEPREKPRVLLTGSLCHLSSCARGFSKCV